MNDLIRKKNLNSDISSVISQFLICKSEYDEVVRTINLNSIRNDMSSNILWQIDNRNQSMIKSLIWWPPVSGMSYITIEKSGPLRKIHM